VPACRLTIAHRTKARTSTALDDCLVRSWLKVQQLFASAAVLFDRNSRSKESSMETITGMFNSHDEAKAAVAALEEAGVPSADISVIGANGSASAGGAGEGAGVGAAIGGVGGLLAGLGAFAIPGIGPVVGAGWLVATLAGAAAGGLIGSLTEAGVSENDAHVYAEGIKRGGTMVVARVDETQEDAAAAILGKHGRVDIGERREEYEAQGWTRFTWPSVNDELDRPPVTPFLPR